MPNTTLKLWLRVWNKMQNNNRFINAYPLVLLAPYPTSGNFFFTSNYLLRGLLKNTKTQFSQF